MNKLTKILGAMMLIVYAHQTSQAQVSGISYTFAPSVEYQDWEKSHGISNGYMIGGQLGFGFGQYIELKANYAQSLNMKRDFSQLDSLGFNYLTLDEQSVDITRWGTDLKINLSNKAIVPFIAAGTGVQTTTLDSANKARNIYFNLGGGFQFSVGDRYTLSLQAMNNTLNASRVKSLTTSEERAGLGIQDNQLDPTNLTNWSYRASLLFYIGGQRNDKLTEVDKAYLETFSSGFKGLSLPLEVTTGQINFSENLPYLDTKYIGVSSGFNFGQYIGLRAYYWRTNEEGYFSTPTRLAILGIDGKFKLSESQGLNPYLSLGGGRIQPLSGYVNAVDPTLENQNTPFASGGIGLDLPFSRFVKLSAYAKALLTSQNSLENAANPDELSTSWAYGLKANFVLGKKSRDVKDELTSVYDQKIEEALISERVKSARLQKDLEEKIVRLEEEIAAAIEDGDKEEFIEKVNEKEATQKYADDLRQVAAQEVQSNYRGASGMVVGITPTEFRSSIEQLKQSNELNMQRITQKLEMDALKAENQTERLNFRIESIQRAVDEVKYDNSRMRNELQNEINALKLQMSNRASSNVAPQQDGSGNTAVIPNQATKQVYPKRENFIGQDQLNYFRDESFRKGFFTNLYYSGASAIGGFNIGGNPTFNLGMRWNYRYKESNFFIMPETFFGFGNPASFGLFINGVQEIPLQKAKNFTPYVGVGAGFLKIGERGEDVIKLTPNIVLGANLFKIAGGRFFVDLSGRSFFKHNQLVAGYRLSF